jgi:hypothetical protein
VLRRGGKGFPSIISSVLRPGVFERCNAMRQVCRFPTTPETEFSATISRLLLGGFCFCAPHQTLSVPCRSRRSKMTNIVRFDI